MNENLFSQFSAHFIFIRNDSFMMIESERLPNILNLL